MSDTVSPTTTVNDTEKPVVSPTTEPQYHNRSKKTDELVVIFGSTGYVGTRLVSRLLREGYRLRVTYRDKSKLQEKSWFDHSNLEYVYCDILKCSTVIDALQGATYVYYLIHSMDADKSKDYESLDIKAARNMVEGIDNSKIMKMVYLGGLGEESDDLSSHLQSRLDVGRILQKAKCEVVVLRAAILIGSGSTSFEIMRYLVDRLPVMLTPKWTHKTISQPIGIRNTIEYLVGSIEVDDLKGGFYDIGGTDVVTYNDMMQILAEENGLRKRLIIPLPVLTPHLSARWVRFITPVNDEVATRLVDGLKNDAICVDNTIRQYIPQKLYGVRTAIRRALHEKQYNLIRQAHGSPSQPPPVEWSQQGDPEYAGGQLYYDRRVIIARGDLAQVWREIESIGGKNGWYHMNFLWRLRGYIDKVLGGPGMSRGREHPTRLNKGDYVDCWRVASIDRSQELTLRAEMKIFGIGTLKFKLHRINDRSDRFVIEQHASYIPRGLMGIIYWKAVAPLHNRVFSGMLTKIVERSDVKKLFGPQKLPTSEELRFKGPYVNRVLQRVD